MADVSPVAFVEAALAYQRTAAIKAAIGLDLFTLIGEGAETIEVLADRTRASQRGLAILCDFLTVLGFLEKADGRYQATASSRAFLDRRSPSYMGGIVDFHAAPEMCAMFLTDPVSYVRNGGTQGLGSIAPGHALWSIFAEAMAQTMAPVAAAVAKRVTAWPSPPRKVLDVAAGHGMFGISIAEAVPGVELTAVDWPTVLKIARRNAAAAGVEQTFRERPGDAFEVDWGAGYDLIVLANFLHHFDPPNCIELLRRARASLSPGGRALAVEFVPNEDRVSPPFPAGFAFYMLGSTPGGNAYTASDFEVMAQSAGFARIGITALPRSAQSLVVFES